MISFCRLSGASSYLITTAILGLSVLACAPEEKTESEWGGSEALDLHFPLAKTSISCETRDSHLPDKNACDLPVALGSSVGAPISGTVTIARDGCPDNDVSPGQGWSPYFNCDGGDWKEKNGKKVPGRGNFIPLRQDSCHPV